MDEIKYYYPGAIHIHTKNSDGTGDIFEISKAAKKAGLSYIIITDHNNFDIQEGIYNEICVIKGEEISPNNGNHYIAIGINNFLEPYEDVSINIANVRQNGGFGFAAHPDESDVRKNKNKPIKWLNKTISGDGVEIWNWFSDFADSYNDGDIFHIAYSYFFREKLISGAPLKSLEWWDKLNNNADNIIPALGGVDAHALKVRKYIIPVTIFSYEYMFKTITNTLIFEKPLSENFYEKKDSILKALKTGRNIIINRKAHANYEVLIKICNKRNSAYCGEKIELDKETFFISELPAKSDIKIFRNGDEIYHTTGQSVRLKILSAGKYRMQVFYKNRPYIYSNPILVV